MYIDNILMSKYELMVEDLSQEALRIGRYLGINVSESFADHLADKYSLEKKKKEIAEFDYKRYGRKHKNGSCVNPETELHDNHINSGNWGQWRTALSPNQITLVEEQIHD